MCLIFWETCPHFCSQVSQEDWNPSSPFIKGLWDDSRTSTKPDNPRNHTYSSIELAHLRTSAHFSDSF